MSLTVRRTPCVGICSTTYGDLVCRGCRRFAHEIRDWNAFTPEQRELVWTRLLEVRDGAVLANVAIEDETAVRVGAGPAVAARESLAGCALHVLRGGALTGLRVLRDTSADPATLAATIDQDAWERSAALFERAYRVPAR